MVNISKKLKIYLYALLALTVLCVVLGTLSYLYSFNASIGYFDASALSLAFAAVCVITVVGALAIFFIIPRKTIDGAAPNKPAAVVSGIPLCAVSALLGIFLLISSCFVLPFGPKLHILHGPTKYMTVIGGILLLISAVYFAMLHRDQERKSEAKALPGFAVPLACVLLVAITYFDLEEPMNSPFKMHFQFAMLAFAAFSLCELRVPLKKPVPRLYPALGIISVLCSGIASIPQIVAIMTEKANEKIYLYYGIFSLCIFVYTVARLCIFANSQSLVEKTAEPTPEESSETEPDVNNESSEEALAPAPEETQDSESETEDQENVSE